MADSAMEKSLKEYRQRLARKIQLSDLIVFGSRQEGRASGDSDIDVLVVSEDFKKMDEEKRFDAVYEAALDIEPEIHPWPITKTELESASKLTVFGQARDQGLRVGK